uniref:Zinc finger PHD-type domain-containing protein n=1 Tax=Bactrocera latifrons TaxID=174628 RepID=A0A0K8V726_BACLA
MPCICGHRIDRAQPKISCHKCNQFFHLTCMNLSQADVDVLLKSKNAFYCKVCAVARKNSIRSPPASPSVRNAHCSDILNSQQQNAEQSNNELSGPLLEPNNPNEVNELLNSLVWEVNSLRSEQSKALTLIQQLLGCSR